MVNENETDKLWNPFIQFFRSPKGVILAFYVLIFTAFLAWEVSQILASYQSAGKPVVVKLTRGSFTMLRFLPVKLPPRAILFFASGDGGWSGFEETISLTLQNHGYEVMGINSNSYAKTDYDLAILQTDFSRMVRAAQKPYGAHPPRVVLAGWSMGAAQVIAAAGGPHPPPDLAGVLVLDPCSRGRYGLRLSDESDFLPTGPGTFGVEEFARTMGGLHIVQWHAAEDSIDSRAWLASLSSPHKEFDFPNTGHYYSHNRDDFLAQMLDCIPWILTPERQAGVTMGRKP